MGNLTDSEKQIQYVTNFHDLVSKPFYGNNNAICWSRHLIGDFSEIVSKLEFSENLYELSQDELRELQLSEQGSLARDILFNDYQLLKELGAKPVLNVIKYYERDTRHLFFPTDVYSFHVDRSLIATDTFLCTYYGRPSEILPNSQAEQKILIPEVRAELKKIYDGSDEGFESFLKEEFFDLHYQPKTNALPMSLGIGHLCKLAVDHPTSQTLPCLHRAPIEKAGESRLLMIC